MTILPLNASPLQRDLEIIAGPQQVTYDSIAAMPGVKYNPPDFMLPWLIWEYGLEHLLPYLTDPRLAIQEGVRWQRIRGTPESVDMALGWLGLADTVIEPEVPGAHFYGYQIDPQRVILPSELDNIRVVTQFSAPLRARLSRLYHGYDVRRVVLDESDYGALLSDYSGVDRDGVVLSFGRDQSRALSLDVDVSAVQLPVRSARVQDVYWPMLDAQPFGGIVNHSVRTSDRGNTAQLSGQSWLGKWDERSWHVSDATLIGGALTPTHALGFDERVEQNMAVAAIKSSDRSIIYLDSALPVCDGIRFTQRSLSVGGEFWGGYWDQRSWSDPGFPLIGDSLSSTYTDITLISEIIVAVNVGLVLNSNHSISLTDNNPIGSNLAGSVLFEERSAGISVQNQFWGGQWDTRSWGDLGFPVIGGAMTLSTITDIPTRQITVAAVIDSSETRSYSISGFDGEPVASNLAGSVHYKERSIGVSIQGQFWRGDWDERIWDDVDYVFIDFTHSRD